MRMDLKTARVAAKLTQKEAAAALGVTEASLCRWERGDRSPKVTTFFRLCELYGVEPGDIFLSMKSGQT